MAKVTGPLFSLTASGKLANAMVHFGWKGLNVVREWLKPSNPKSADQGNVRMILGGLGRATRVIETGSAYKTDAIAVAGPQQTFVSALVGWLVTNVFKSGATLDFDTEYTEYDGHDAKAAFVSSAATLGLVDFDIAYKGATNTFVAGMQLYELAKYGISRRNAVEGAFDRSPFDTALADWAADEIAELVADIQAV